MNFKIPCLILFLTLRTICVGQNFGADSILSYYNFESTVDDQIGSVDGSVNGAGYRDGVCGNSNSSLHFDGVDDYLSLGDFDTLNHHLERFGVSFWFKANHDTLNRPQSIMGTINNGNSSTALDLKIHSGSGNSFERNRFTFQMRDNNNKFFTLSLKHDSLFNGDWHHVVVNVQNANNGNGNIWIDNQKQVLATGSNTGFSTYSRFDHDVVIGCKSDRGTRSSFFNGFIDNLLFAAPLDSAEVSTLYNSKKCDVLKIRDFEEHVEVRVYPNPVTYLNHVFIHSMTGNMVIQRVTLHALTGQIHEISLKDIDHSFFVLNLPKEQFKNGLYFLCLHTESSIVTHKISIKRD